MGDEGKFKSGVENVVSSIRELLDICYRDYDGFPDEITITFDDDGFRKKDVISWETLAKRGITKESLAKKMKGGPSISAGLKKAL